MLADVAITTVTSILIFTSILGNSIVCFVITRNRDMRIPINYLLVNLAVADIMYSTFHIPVLVFIDINTHPEGVTGKILCVIRNGIFAWIGATSSIFTLAAIAVERYYAVIHPHGNKGKLTLRKLKVIIPGSWILSFILTFSEFLRLDFVKEIDPNFCTWPKQWMARADSLVWYVFSLLSIILLAGLYTRVVYTLWFKRNTNDGNDLTHQQQGVLRVRKRVTLMVAIVSVIFGVSWGTDAILHVLEDVGSFKLSPAAIPVAHTLIMFNAAVNPFAYALINHRFREKMKGILSCSFRVHAARKPQDIELARDQPTNTVGATRSDALEANSHTNSVNPSGQHNWMISVVTSEAP